MLCVCFEAKSWSVTWENIEIVEGKKKKQTQEWIERQQEQRKQQKVAMNSVQSSHTGSMGKKDSQIEVTYTKLIGQEKRIEQEKMLYWLL